MLWLDSHSGDLRRGVPFVGTSLSYSGSCPWAEFKAYERVYIRNYTTITDTCMNWNEISVKFACLSRSLSLKWLMLLIEVIKNSREYLLFCQHQQDQGFPRRISAGNSIVKLGQFHVRCSELFGRKVNAWIMHRKESVSSTFSCDFRRSPIDEGLSRQMGNE